jgi:hypothetical protein
MPSFWCHECNTEFLFEEPSNPSCTNCGSDFVEFIETVESAGNEEFNEDDPTMPVRQLMDFMGHMMNVENFLQPNNLNSRISESESADNSDPEPMNNPRFHRFQFEWPPQPSSNAQTSDSNSDNDDGSINLDDMGQVNVPLLLQTLFSHAYGSMNMEQAQSGPGNIMNPLFELLGMRGNPGDYATSQATFDDIISRLMEQTSDQAPPPTPADDIKALPREPVTVQDLETQKDCSICQDDFVLGDTVVILPCNHRFDENCIVPWLTRSGTCPVCRQVVKST